MMFESLKAMSKEANIVHGLLKLDQNHMDRFAKLNICESQRRHLREFLIGIRNCKFPEYDLYPNSICHDLALFLHH